MAIIEISYCCFCHIQSKPWDRLISCIFERHQICQSGKKRKVSTQSIHNNNDIVPESTKEFNHK
jgi:hypothetical protein